MYMAFEDVAWSRSPSSGGGVMHAKRVPKASMDASGAIARFAWPRSPSLALASIGK